MWWEEEPGDGAVARGELAVADPGRGYTGAAGSDWRRPVQSAADPWQWWWDRARASAHAFLAGRLPPEIAIFGPVLDEEERGLFEADLSVSVFHGGDGRYARSDCLVVGRPVVMVGALAVNAAINHRRKVAARRDATPQWRDQRMAHLWATSYRLIFDRGLGLEHMSYADVTGFYPDLGGWSLALATRDGAPPVRMQGPAVPLVALWTATAVLGDRWARDPRLGALLR